MAPLIPLVLARYSLAKSRWAALFIGLFMDLITSSAPFGLYSLCFTLTSAFLYKHRRHFFIDKAIGLPSFTFFGSLLSTCIFLLLLALFGAPIPITKQSILADFFFMPALDGVYAFLWFNCPVIAYNYIKKHKPHLQIYKKIYKRHAT